MVRQRFRPLVSLLIASVISMFASEAHAVGTLAATSAVRSAPALQKKRAAIAGKKAVKRKKVKAISSKKQRRSASGKKKVRVVERIRFLRQADDDRLPRLSVAQKSVIRRMFARGKASPYSPAMLLSSNVFVKNPLVGGIFKRDQKVKYIILHSTETATEADAPRVIRSWNNRGLRHPGAQYLVDRDGLIYQTVDPSYGSVHVNASRTRFGVNNHNTVGIEIVRSGQQMYTAQQKASVARLVVYLQQRFGISDAAVLAHGYVQPSNRRDPVAFDWLGFQQLVAAIRPDQVRIAAAGQAIVGTDQPAVARRPAERGKTYAVARRPARRGKTYVSVVKPSGKTDVATTRLRRGDDA